ncbi:hypothetical protein BU23DRAFT_100084 [Bimuria novae-zelandiae CBS 107.79]|uniref:Uncharacterized protein n=1 Tax=Bimuria novae-zelandiae CBS 107.79 TaxID=1447943 RepID=A0A6A5VXA7_9PLEO|nr:hypothetical protein BU23DRAFT_100084 [Bimuria novae-zelandiae CBS 107.79]
MCRSSALEICGVSRAYQRHRAHWLQRWADGTKFIIVIQKRTRGRILAREYNFAGLLTRHSDPEAWPNVETKWALRLGLLVWAGSINLVSVLYLAAASRSKAPDHSCGVQDDLKAGPAAEWIQQQRCACENHAEHTETGILAAGCIGPYGERHAVSLLVRAQSRR